jgi:histidine triad (HIT) family protein
VQTNCIFCSVAHGQTPADILYRDNQVFVIKDIAPKAPTHLLIIPIQHISEIDQATSDHESLLGHLFLVAKRVAVLLKVASDGYRLVINQGTHAGMSVDHIHMHLLGGAPLGAMG